ncbi:TetR/AcrR family transcriptional regulator [Actinomycetospora termitidis]|uniref:TetR/AcrR family transcriptional regulator n=1 Tax=Actinomycetospora termitidis TaxID=3053470 RepID=A0ABT7M689_9PSEU|nr:TetR/AcrR family transcriptional regulator [Actinomycetospora sp. Odt1-22]MDL5156190.1 TetR/AcrR family transcriptional regulator [Actinomycetospora sp. Odt1-22]
MPRSTIMQDELTRAATRLFQARGIRAVSLQDIAEEVGVTKAALYHYFANRDDLLRHVFGDWIKRDIAKLDAVTSIPGTAREKLHGYVRHHVECLTESIELYSLSFSSEAELPAEVRAEFRRFKRESDLVVRGIIREGVQNGEFVDGDERSTVFAIDGMCNWLWKWYKASGPMTPDQIADQFSDLVLYGLAARNGRPTGGPADLSRAEMLRYHARAIRFHSEKLEELTAESDGVSAP